MRKTASLFRTYCIVCIAVLCILLFTVGFFTAKHQTETAVFKAAYSVVRVYSSPQNLTLNFAGKVINVSPKTVLSVFNRIRGILLIPFNNIIDLVRVLV